MAYRYFNTYRVSIPHLSYVYNNMGIIFHHVKNCFFFVCIADVHTILSHAKCTILLHTARLFSLQIIIYFSRCIGIKSDHYKVRVQTTLVRIHIRTCICITCLSLCSIIRCAAVFCLSYQVYTWYEQRSTAVFV